jgi:hypothetical protein
VLKLLFVLLIVLFIGGFVELSLIASQSKFILASPKSKFILASPKSEFIGIGVLIGDRVSAPSYIENP